MKKLKFCIILLVVLHLNYPLHSQTYKVKDTILRTPQTQNAIYQARDRIEFGPGFVFDSQGGTGKTFKAEIREDLIFNADYLENTVDISNSKINTDLYVGSIKGSAAVDMAGGATYTIPIEISEGTCGVQPSLSIVYNSHVNNGLLGYGWSLSGMSAIIRVGKTKYYDGENSNVNLDNNDRYALDGIRLMLFNGVYGSPESEYKTEQESFSKITAKGNYHGSPEYFTVMTKEGYTLYYGLSADSKYILNSNSPVYMYMLSKVIDLNGNYMNYRYSMDENTKEMVLASIEYTGNNNLLPYNEIKFYYEKRFDEQVFYVSGNPVRKNMLLRQIKSFSSGACIKTYDFSYCIDGLYTKLNLISQIGINGEKINPQIINYGKENTPYSIVTANIKNCYYDTIKFDDGLHIIRENRAKTYNFGDFNNDGISDLVVLYEFTTIDQHLIINSTLEVFLGTGTGDYLTDPYYVMKYDYKGQNNSQIIVRDFNQDGYDDILTLTKNDMEPEGRYLIKIMLGPDLKDSYSLSGKEWHPFNIDYSEQRYITNIDVQDFDGDGLLDILTQIKVSKGKQQYHALDIYLVKNYNKDNKFLECQKYIICDGHETNSYITFHTDDLNLNGKPEIIASFEHEDTKIFEFNSENFLQIKSWGYPTYWHKQYYGDFNGDGYKDLLTWVNNNNDNNNGTWELMINDGKLNWESVSGFECPITKKVNPDYEEIDYNYYMIDVNSDGYCDIVEFYLTGNINDRSCIMNVYYGNGSKMYKSSYTIQDVPHLSLNDKTRWVNINKDNSADMMFAVNYYSKPQKIICFNPFNNNMLVKEIIDGLGNKIIFEYESCLNANVYSSNLKSNSSLMVKTLPFNVVSKLIDGVKIYNYKYKNLILHLEGKGFLGFLEMEIANNIDNHINKSIYDISAYNSLYLKETNRLYNNQMISRTKYYNEFFAPYSNEKIFINKQNGKYTLDEITGFFEELKIETFDDYLNPILSYKFIGNQTNNKTYIEKTEISGYINAGSWCNRLPVSVKISQSDNSGSIITNKVTNVYDAKGNLLEEKYDCGVESLNYSKQYGDYDIFGNSRSHKITAGGVTRSSSCIFDETGRYIINKTDAMGNKISSQFDLMLGFASENTDINNKKTKFYYDGLGRLLRIIDPNGINSESAVGWCTNLSGNATPQIPQTSVWYSNSKTDGNHQEYIFYDKRGVELCKAVQQSESSKYEWLYFDKLYDNFGRIIAEYLPRTVREDNDKYTGYTYYETGIYTGKLKRINNPDGSYVEYQYSGAKMIEIYNIDNIHKTSTTTVNEKGEIICATDDGGTINYAYYLNGKPKQIDYNGSVYLINYDAAGNCKELNDPASGLTKSKYNAFGELVSYQQANQRENNLFYKMNYDILGRLTSKLLINGNFDNQSGTIIDRITYVYDAENNLNSVKEETSGNYKKIYNYDNNGRLSKIKETVLDNGSVDREFEFSYNYDDFGRLQQQTYPGSFKVSFEYDSRGYMSGIKKGINSNILKNITYNNNGDIKKYKLGNALIVEKNFDNQNRLVMINSYSENNVLKSIYKMEYGYTIDGNMSFRKYKNLKETFNYDILSRLTETVVQVLYDDYSNATMYTVNYNDNKISSRNNIGEYKYSTNGSNALERIKNPVELEKFSNCNITYNPLSKLETIEQNGVLLKYIYGTNEDRIKCEIFNDSGKKTKYYAGSGNYELKVDEKGNETEYSYIYGDDGPIAVNIKYKSSGEQKLYYFLKDHLGSIMALLSENGNSYTIEEEMSYDPWGRQRNTTDWSYEKVQTSDIIDRGFCFHEHLHEFDLINMNGRIYDPILGLFLSPDPYIQAPDFTQNLNRYSYCFNNPLKYTDQSGNFVELLVMAGVFINMSVQIASGKINTIKGFMSTLFINSLVSLTSTLFAMVVLEENILQGMQLGLTLGSTSGFIDGFFNELLTGDHKFMSALYGGLTGAAVGALIGGIRDGVIARQNGGRFWDGMIFTYESGFEGIPISDIPADGLEYSNEFARKLAVENFDVNLDEVTIYADGTAPENYNLKDGFFKKIENEGQNENIIISDKRETRVRGVTLKTAENKYEIYLSPSIFADKNQLLLTFQHELLHVEYFKAGYTSKNSDMIHANIYKWQYQQAKLWFHDSSGSYYNLYKKYKPFYNRKILKPKNFNVWPYRK